jgi:hypothetical protein
MEYEHTEWRIRELIDLVDQDRLDLSPSYQRNPVWRSSSQTKLLESILCGRPIPNFFILERNEGNLEMVDGQQRARTIIGYFKNQIPDHTKRYFEQALDQADFRQSFQDGFFDYRLPITLIKNLDENEKIEDYYTLLNSSGLRLNRPELKKAEYYGTRFLRLVRSATEYDSFHELELFTSQSLARMTDFEIASEIIAQIRFGPSDKKEKVDQLFEDDISIAEESRLMEEFCSVFDILKQHDSVYPLKRTRLKQKADIYTFSYFVHTKRQLPYSTQLHFYKVFLKISPFIRPSNEDCEPFREYAHNCVTQSNSKKARETRLLILNEILANDSGEPSQRQMQTLDFFKLTEASLIDVDGFISLNFSDLQDPKQIELSFTDFFEDVL